MPQPCHQLQGAHTETAEGSCLEHLPQDFCRELASPSTLTISGSRDRQKHRPTESPLRTPSCRLHRFDAFVSSWTHWQISTWFPIDCLEIGIHFWPEPRFATSHGPAPTWVLMTLGFNISALTTGGRRDRRCLVHVVLIRSHVPAQRGCG